MKTNIPKIWNEYRAQSNLFKGALKGKLELVEKSLKYGAQIDKRYYPPSDGVDARDDYGASALSLALQNHHLDVARYLLEQGANPFERAPNMWIGASITQILKKGWLDLLEIIDEKWEQKELEFRLIAPIHRRKFPNDTSISIIDYLRKENPEASQIWEAKMEKKKLSIRLNQASHSSDFSKSHRL